MNGSVYANNSLRALTGFPVFTYLNDDYTDTKNTNIPALFKLIDDGLKANYLAGFETVGFPGQSNKCGLPNFHAYSILGAFTVDTTDLLLVRDPTGTTAYKNTDWDKDSAKWTDEAKKLVPLGVDPTTSAAQGIFAIPIAKIDDTSGGGESCISRVHIAHNRGADSFYHAWYDVDGDTGDGTKATTFSTKIPKDVKAVGDIYITVDSYYEGIIPSHTSCYQYDSKIGFTPVRTTHLKKGGTETEAAATDEKDYGTIAYHLKAADVAAEDLLTLDVTYKWFKLPTDVKDYTVGIYTAMVDASDAKMKVLKSADYTGDENMLHMDGQKPSGFKDPSGSTAPSTTGSSTTATVKAVKQPKCFIDLFDLAETDAEWWDLLWNNFWVVFVWFNLGW